MRFHQRQDEADEQAHADDEKHGAEGSEGDLAQWREMIRRPEVIIVHSRDTTSKPDRVEGLQIPTYAEVQARIAEMLTRDVQRGLQEETAASLAAVFTTPTRTDTDLFDFIAFSKACHSAADVMRKHGDLDQAGLYFAMGQDLLTKAAEAYSALVAAYGQTQPQH